MNLLKKLFGANELFVATVLYNMHTVIAQEAEKYQETALVKASSEVPTTPTDIITESERLIKEMRKLEQMGLSKTKNHQLLKQRVDELLEQIKQVSLQESARKKAQELVQYIKVLKQVNPNSFLISVEQFTNVCKKYNLSVGLLDEYTGTIPEKNIQELSEVRKRSDLYLNKGLLQITSIYGVYSESVKSKIKASLDKRSRFVMGERRENPAWGGYTLDFPQAVLEAYRQEWGTERLDFGTSNVASDKFLIACPESQLKRQELKFADKPIDPIVFQYCPYGIVVHTIWGEEAEDSVIKQYQETNQLIQNF